jgi:hypothetical protein
MYNMAETTLALPIYGEGGPPKAVGGALVSEQQNAIDCNRSAIIQRVNSFRDCGLFQKKEAPPTTLRVVPPPRKRGGPRFKTVLLMGQTCQTQGGFNA